MDIYDLTKIARNNSYDLTVNKSKNFFLISFLGIWDKTAQLEFYLEDIKRALQIISFGFNLIIDLSQYKGSTSEYINLHVEAQNLAIKAGLNKTAVILQDNPMLKVTVDYIFNQTGINPTYFKNFSVVEHWLSIL